MARGAARLLYHSYYCSTTSSASYCSASAWSAELKLVQFAQGLVQFAQGISVFLLTTNMR